MASEQEKNMLPPNRHQFVQSTVYFEPVFGLLDSGVILIVMSEMLANKLKLSLTPTETSIIVADGLNGGTEISSDVPTGFGKIVTA